MEPSDALHDPLAFLHESIAYRENLGFRINRVVVSPDLADLAIWDVKLMNNRSLDIDETLQGYDFRVELDKMR